MIADPLLRRWRGSKRLKAVAVSKPFRIEPAKLLFLFPSKENPLLRRLHAEICSALKLRSDQSLHVYQKGSRIFLAVPGFIQDMEKYEQLTKNFSLPGPALRTRFFEIKNRDFVIALKKALKEQQARQKPK